MVDLIRQYFDKQALLGDSEWDMFKAKLIERKFNKGDFIIKEGEIENYLSFLVQGFVRNFYITNKGDEITIEFVSGGFASVYDSFLSRDKSIVCMEALENVVMLSISYNDLNELYQMSKTGERLGRLNAESYLLYMFKRRLSLLTLSAEERYLELIKENPKLLNYAKLQHIASYLGIKPESLSRIRKNIK